MRAVPLKRPKAPSSSRPPTTASRGRRAGRGPTPERTAPERTAPEQHRAALEQHRAAREQRSPSARGGGSELERTGARPATFALFDTPVGRCAIAWRGTHVVELHLPEETDSLGRARLWERLPQAEEGRPPRAVERAIELVQTLLRGEGVDLTEIELDLDGVPPFHRRVYELARTIPPGATVGYGELAAQLGSPGAARAVGQALSRNPCAIVVPCHRVLAAGGKVGGFTAAGGTTTKLRLLELERGAGRAT